MAGPRLAYGYARLGEGVRVGLDAHRAEIAHHATALGLLLGGVFSDSLVRPALERPGLRALLDVLWEFQPYAVVVPSLWHLSGRADELAALRERFRHSACRLLTVRDPS